MHCSDLHAQERAFAPVVSMKYIQRLTAYCTICGLRGAFSEVLGSAVLGWDTTEQHFADETLETCCAMLCPVVDLSSAYTIIHHVKTLTLAPLT